MHQAAQYADGIQLSDETAVGKYPLETIEVVREMRRQVVENGPGLRSNGDGPVIWITGRPGSGKTTLANALAAHLKSLQVRATQIDGDEARSFTQGVLGYSEEDRITNQRYLAYASKKAAEGGGVVIVASLSPYERLRQWARDSIPHYFEVYVDCPFEVCVKRDPKNHYARAFQGEIRDYPGVDMDYEVPNHPDCVVDTSRGSVDECMSQVIESLQSAGFLNDVARVSHDAGMPVSPPHS